MTKIDKLIYKAKSTVSDQYNVLVVFEDGERRTLDILTAMELAIGGNPKYPVIKSVQAMGRTLPILMDIIGQFIEGDAVVGT